MRNISAEAKALALAPARRISARAIVTHLIDGKWGTEGDIYNQNDKLQSLSISLGSNSGGFTVGETYCGKLTLTLIGDDLDIRQDDRVHIVLGFFDDIKGAVTFKSTYSGYFFVDKITRNKKLTTVVAFDKMLRFSKNYISKLTYPALLSEMLAELSEQCATELADDVAVPYDAQIKSAPIKGTDKAGKKIYYTRREMLGYCAALCGSSFFMDNNDKLALVTNADCSETILPENTISETHEPLEFEITEVVWSEDGNSVMRDDINTAGIVEFANPLDVGDKEQALKAISAKIVGLKYFEAAIKGQGKGWYELGDVVSVKISDSQTIKIRISGINYEVKNGAFTETLYSSALTESQSNYTSGDVSGGAVKPTYGGTSAGALTEYNVLSDTSVKYNGTTYTAELADSGLISKITDDKGGEFSPTHADGVTDVALHNAAFLAVAMLSGLALYDCLTPMCVYRFNTDKMVQEADTITWNNQADSGYNNDLLFIGGSINARENSVYVQGAQSSYGHLSYICKIYETDYYYIDTIYLVAKTATANALRTLQTPGRGPQASAVALTSDSGNWAFKSYATDSIISTTSEPSTKKSVIVIRNNTFKADVFINGQFLFTTSSSGVISGEMWIGRTQNSYYDGGYYIYDLACAGSLHSDEDIVRNSRYLMRKYNIGG